MTEEKPLQNFNFYKNIKIGKTIEDVIEEYNTEYLERHINREEVKFGPKLQEDWDTETYKNGQTQNSKKKIYFRFRRSYKKYLDKLNLERDINKIQGAYIFEEESRKYNLKEIVERIKKENYFDLMGVRQLYGSQLFLSSEEFMSLLERLGKKLYWKFERLYDSERLGFLKTTRYTYLIKKVLDRGFIFYKEDGSDLNLRNKAHLEVIEAIRKPISKTLAGLGHEFYDEWKHFDDDSRGTALEV